MEQYYYKFDILCHEYIWGGIVECDLEDYFSSKDEIYEWAEEYVIENYGEEQFDTLKEWGGIEIQINYTEDPKFKGTGVYSEDDEMDDED